MDDLLEDDSIADEEFEKLIPLIDLQNLINDFSRKPTFDLARIIWLMCYDNKREVPSNVLQKFIEGIRVQNYKKTDDIIEKNRKKFQGDFEILCQEAKFKNQGLSPTTICDKLAEILTKREGAEHTYASVKQKLHRLHKKYPWCNKLN
ncbi:MAG: hypothetical protein ACYDBT_09700 [Desulfobulbaceae bacterium]